MLRKVSWMLANKTAIMSKEWIPVDFQVMSKKTWLTYITSGSGATTLDKVKV